MVRNQVSSLKMDTKYKRTPVGDLPVDWEVVSVKEIGELGRGRVINKQELQEQSGDYPVYSSQSKDNGVFGYIDKYDFDGEYVTWTTDGAYAGTIFYRTGKFNCTNVCGTIKAKNVSSIDMKYLAYALSLRSKKHVSYVGNPKLMNNIMAEIVIPFPPINEQKIITEILTSVDSAIEKSEIVIEKTKQLKNGLMQQLLMGKKRLPCFSGKWEVRRFGEIALPRTERIDSRKAGDQSFCVELEHMGQATGQLIGNGIASKQSSLKTVFKTDDVLFGKLRAYLRKYWLANRDGVCSTEIWVLVAQRQMVTPGFLYQIVQTDGFMDAANTVYGTHMPRSDWKIVKNYSLPMPGIEEQIYITSVLSAVDYNIEKSESHRHELEQVKKAMMNLLLTGKIRVSF